MKNKILALLAVAAVGSVAAAQVTLSDTQPVATVVAVNNSFEITSAAGEVALTLNGGAVNTVLTYTTNDGFEYDITATALAWTTTRTDVTVYPVLTADGDTLISSGNIPAPVVLATAISDVEAATTTVPLMVASGPVLMADTYNTTVTYTFE